MPHCASLRSRQAPKYRNRLREAEAARDEITAKYTALLRGTIEAPADAGREDIERQALAEPNVLKFIGEGQVRKVIVVPGKIVNIVVA